MSLTTAISLIRGPAGTQVELVVHHPNEDDTALINIVRAEVTVPTVDWHLIGDGIALLNIYRFSDPTANQLELALEEIEKSSAEALILDLRGNPGGLIDSVVDVASYFLGGNKIVLTVINNKGKEQEYSSTTQSLENKLPMVVLVDSTSASGSEVLAGALKDNDRAIIAGGVTFGKGSVNRLYELGDETGIYITIARWYTPDGQLIESQGIKPTYELQLEGEELINWAVDYFRLN
jgi:carboxyl-terminal processing protease